MKKVDLKTNYLLIHIVSLFIIHTFYVYVYTISSTLRNDYLLQISLRLFTWSLPVVIYLIMSKINVLDYLKLRKYLIKGVIWGITVGIGIVLLQMIGIYFQHNNISINLDLGIGVWLKSIILVGFSEEILFRGFILQKILERHSFTKSNIIQTILFTLIHFPGWILQNQFVYPTIILSILFIFVIGLALGYVMKKSDSLWSCIFIHSFVNFASLCIVH